MSYWDEQVVRRARSVHRFARHALSSAISMRGELSVQDIAQVAARTPPSPALLTIAALQPPPPWNPRRTSSPAKRSRKSPSVRAPRCAPDRDRRDRPTCADDRGRRRWRRERRTHDLGWRAESEAGVSAGSHVRDAASYWAMRRPSSPESAAREWSLRMFARAGLEQRPAYFAGDSRPFESLDRTPEDRGVPGSRPGLATR